MTVRIVLKRSGAQDVVLALGYTNVEAGKMLFISERTIETHRTSIITKLKLNNRAELVRFALDNALAAPSCNGGPRAAYSVRRHR